LTYPECAKITSSILLLLIWESLITQQNLLWRFYFVKVYHLKCFLISVIDSERILTSPYAPSNLNAYLTANAQLLSKIYEKTLPPSLPKALASLPSSPAKSISSLLSRSPKRKNRDTLDSVRSSVFDSPSTTSQSSSDSTSRTTNSSVEEGVVIGKRSNFMFLGPEIKERGAVAGVRSFVEGIRGKGWPGESYIKFGD
jgi:hypothetical protein